MSTGDWLRERAAFYGSGIPTFEASKRAGDSPDLAEAKAIIAEFEALYGPVPDRQAAVQQALEKIQERNRRRSFGGY